VRLARRIAAQPATSTAAVTGGAASPGGTPAVMPLAQVSVYPTASDNSYSTIGYSALMPAWTGDGGAVVFTQAKPRHARLHAAGRP
jgi:hypothetical protein